jgi:hypothetical protein
VIIFAARGGCCDTSAVRDDFDKKIAGGNVNQVVRVGDTVRRPAGPWTPAVHALLTHLHNVGFSAGPRPLGVEELGREVLTLSRVTSSGLA